MESDYSVNFGTLNHDILIPSTSTSEGLASTPNDVIPIEQDKEVPSYEFPIRSPFVHSDKASQSDSIQQNNMAESLILNKKHKILSEYSVESNDNVDIITSSTLASKANIEYVDLKGEHGYEQIIGEAPNAERDNTTLDIVKAIKEQATHDLLCPMCGSCITKRVILRKRKRTSAILTERLIEKTEHEDIPEINNNQIEEDGDVEVLGCLACLSTFFRRVESMGRQCISSNKVAWYNIKYHLIGTEQHEEAPQERVTCLSSLLLWGADKSAILKQVGGRDIQTSASQGEITEKSNFNCIPFLLPGYEWEGMSKKEGAPLSLGISWKKYEEASRKYLSNLLPKHHLESIKQVNATKEEAQTSDHQEEREESRLNCLPILLPEYAWGSAFLSGKKEVSIRKEEPEKSEYQGEVFEKSKLNGLPIRFPEYTWGNAAGKEEVNIPKEEAQASGHQEDVMEKSKINCFPVRLSEYAWRSALLSGKKEINMPNDETQTSECQEEVTEKSTLNCLPILLPEYAWGSALSFGKKENILREAAQTSEHREEVIEKSKLNCLPILLPEYAWKSALLSGKKDASISTEVNQKEEEHLSCLPILLPKYPWENAEGATSGQHATISETREEGQEEYQQGITGTSKLNCIPMLLPEYMWGNAGSFGKEGCFNCLPILLPKYPWKETTRSESLQAGKTTDADLSLEHQEELSGAQEIGEPKEEARKGEKIEKSNVNCMPMLLPKYIWGSAASHNEEEVQRTTESQHEKGAFSCLPVVLLIVYIRDSIGAFHLQDVWSKNEEKEVLVNDISREEKPLVIPSGSRNEAVEFTMTSTEELGTSIETVKVDEMLKVDQSSVATKDLEVLIETVDPETVADVLEPSKQASSTDASGASEQKPPQDSKHSGNNNIICDCLPYSPPMFHWKWPMASYDLNEPFISRDGSATKIVSEGHYSTSTTTIGDQETVIQVDGTSATSVTEGGIGLHEHVSAPCHIIQQQYLKSIAYGGLETSLASLGVVASAAGAQAKTVTVLAMGLANLLTCLLVLLHNIMVMYLTDEATYKANVGHGPLAILSCFIFGSISPVTYGLSFTSSDLRASKFALTAALALLFLVPLGLLKAQAQRQSYRLAVTALVTVGLAASITGFLAGDLVRRWLEKIGFDMGQNNEGSSSLFNWALK